MHWLCIPLTVYQWNIPTAQTVWGEPKLNHSLYRLLQLGRHWKWVWVCLQTAVVIAANPHINNYSKNIISLLPVGPLSSVGPGLQPIEACVLMRPWTHIVTAEMFAGRSRVWALMVCTVRTAVHLQAPLLPLNVQSGCRQSCTLRHFRFR